MTTPCLHAVIEHLQETSPRHSVCHLPEAQTDQTQLHLSVSSLLNEFAKTLTWTPPGFILLTDLCTGTSFHHLMQSWDPDSIRSHQNVYLNCSREGIPVRWPNNEKVLLLDGVQKRIVWSSISGISACFFCDPNIFCSSLEIDLFSQEQSKCYTRSYIKYV